ncbi:MAG: peptidylprolyl isomerase [Eubacteriales bacterium]|nr:peptidylprolyl isomerase [Eubacteriales bacterium]
MEEKKVIAVAAGKEITEEEFNQFASRVEQQDFINTPEGRKQALAQYANYFLFEKLGEEKGYDKSEEFLKLMDGARRELLSQYALTQEVKDIVATEEECREYYEKNQAMFQRGAQAKAKHILTATEEESQRILGEIQRGEKSFEDAAKEYSTCPSAAKGGELGTFGRGQMVKEFDEAAFTGEVGKLLGPVKTNFGYHLIVVDERTEASVAPFEQVASRIGQQLAAQKQNEKYMAVRANLIEKYGLEYK